MIARKLMIGRLLLPGLASGGCGSDGPTQHLHPQIKTTPVITNHIYWVFTLLLALMLPMQVEAVPSFAAAVNFAAGSAPFSVTSADFNGDGKADMVVANYSSGNVSVFLGDGLGGFAAAVNFAAGTFPISVTSAAKWMQKKRMNLNLSKKGP